MMYLGPVDTQSKVDKILSRHRKMKSDKEPWNVTYQRIGELVMTRKQDFTQDISPGQFLTGNIFDSTASNANHLLASSLIGALYPNGAKTFQIDPPNHLKIDERDTEETKLWFEKVSQIMADVMDNPKSGFLTSLEEYMVDQGAFGISGIGVFEAEDTAEVPVRFQAVDAKRITIAEGSDGFVDTCYVERQMTCRQAIQEFGWENVSQTTYDAYKAGDCEKKIKVLHAVEPLQHGAGSFGTVGMPIASIHIEIEAKHILKESGYYEMPIFVTRFWKTMNEIYGRSPAMEAMPDIIEANSLRELSIIATEKMLDPPVLVSDDGTLGGGDIDLSAGATVVRRVSGRMADLNHKAVEPIITVVEMQSTFKRISELREIILNNFFIDRLLDLNNEQRMTAYETGVRNDLRGQSLGTIYARQIAELFTRVVERVFKILLTKGMLGVLENSREYHIALLNGEVPFVIPQVIADLMLSDKDAFKITFISPAARIMRNEELLGIQRTIAFASELAQLQPDVLDNIDLDQAIKDMQDLTGAPARIIRSSEKVKQIRTQRAQAQQAQQELMQQHAQAEIFKLAGQGAAFAAKGQGVAQLPMAA